MTVPALLATFPRERTWLLPALQAVQRAERWLAPEALEAVAAHLRVPRVPDSVSRSAARTRERRGTRRAPR